MTEFELISKREAEWLSELETKISMGMKTFVEVGNALLEIRDNRLYRESHKTFEDYCQEKWGMTDRRARMLITAAGTMGIIETGTIVPGIPHARGPIPSPQPCRIAAARRCAQQHTR